MSADNAVLARIEDQDEATRAGFAAHDLALAKALGQYWAARQFADEPLKSFAERENNAGQSAISGLRHTRTRIAEHLMAAQLSNPNARQSIAGMAEWAVLGADILLNKLATQRAVHVGATPPA